MHHCAYGKKPDYEESDTSREVDILEGYKAPLDFPCRRQPRSNREANLPHGRCCIWQKVLSPLPQRPSIPAELRPVYYASTTINLCFGPSFKPLALEIGGGGRRAGGRKEDLLCAEPTQPRPENGVRSLLCPVLRRPRCGTRFRLRWEGEWVCECGEKEAVK